MTLHKSAEDYLETILVLQRRNGSVHAVDIAAERNFSKPSVSVAVKHLRENGYITVDPDHGIKLTEMGEQVAEEIYDRHQVLAKWLIALGIPPEKAQDDACKMEHAISEESIDAIKKHCNHCLYPTKPNP